MHTLPPVIPTDTTDEAIAALVQTGDQAAFGVLVSRYEKKITRYANKFLWNYEDRQDAIQEVFIKAYTHIQNFRTHEKFSPWLYRIAHNTFITMIKKQGREKISFFDIDTLFGGNIPDEDTIPKKEQREEREVLDQCLEKIPSKYREPLVLFYFEEKNYEEIADILHIPKATVGVRLRRGREMMKREYQTQQIHYE